LLYVTAKRLLEVIQTRFTEFGFPLYEDRGIISDPSTLFVCSGMQKLKSRFRHPDGTTYGSLQHCVRTNDLELVGDGSHLTQFVMIGNFSFGGPSYQQSVWMWDRILRDLGIESTIHVHPTQTGHREYWKQLGYVVVPDAECVWSDGDIGGYCSEVYVGELEIGNLVNPLEHSTDVGFGLERLLQILEGCDRVDQTSLFDQRLDPVVRDHYRTLLIMRENGIRPGNKGREYVCRRLLRRSIRRVSDLSGLTDWMEQERELLERGIRRAKKHWRRHQDKLPEWWWDTFGVLPEDLEL
jgi:alanyl-tRNA synthetase